MNRARQQLLARPALAADQDAGIRACDHARFLEQFRHSTASADDGAAPAVVCMTHRRGTAGRSEIQRLLDLVQQNTAVERLGQIAVHPLGCRFDGVRDAAVRGQQNYGQRGVLATDLVEQRETVAIRQPYIADHQIGALGRQARKRRFGAVRGCHAVAIGGKAHRQQPQQVCIVVDHQQVRAIDRNQFANRHCVFSGLIDGNGVTGRVGRLRSMAASASSFSCNCSARRWLSRAIWPSLSACTPSLRRSAY